MVGIFVHDFKNKKRKRTSGKVTSGSNKRNSTLSCNLERVVLIHGLACMLVDSDYLGHRRQIYQYFSVTCVTFIMNPILIATSFIPFYFPWGKRGGASKIITTLAISGILFFFFLIWNLHLNSPNFGLTCQCIKTTYYCPENFFCAACEGR